MPAGRFEPVLIGRAFETATLDQLLEQAAAGHGSTVVIRGEPGIGKTALLEYLRAKAAGFTVLRAAGVDFEPEVDYSALRRIISPLLEQRGMLPEPQNQALSVALGLEAGPVPSRYLVGLAVLGLMAAGSRNRPLLCLVDDAQWLDQASAQTLALAARRVETERILVVFAQRATAVRPELAGLPEIPLSGLNEADARAVLTASVRAPLDSRVRTRIVVEARGNPLALVELGSRAGPADLAGGFAPVAAEPVSVTVEHSFRERIERLPEQTRRFLLLAAAEPLGDPLLLWGAAEFLGLDTGDLTSGLAGGLIEVDNTVRFRHPLVRSAVYHSASPSELRATHCALAEATDAVTDPDRRAWHRGQSASGTDEDAAVSLDAAAGRVAARGGVAAAAAYLELAARLSQDPLRRANRTIAAASAKRDAGDIARALELLASAEEQPLDAIQRARGQRIRAQITFESDRGDAAVAMLLRAADAIAAVDLPAARDCLLDAFAVEVFAGRRSPAERVAGIAKALRGLGPSPDPPRPNDLLVDALSTRLTEGYAAAVPSMRTAVAAFRNGGEGNDATFHSGIGWLRLAAVTAMDLCDEESWLTLTERQVAWAKRSGTIAALPVSLNLQAVARIHAGDFAAARALIGEAYSIAAAIGMPPSPHGDALLSAWSGDEARTLELADLGIRAGTERGEGRLLTVAEHCRAMLLNSLGRHEEAFRTLEPAADADDLGFAPMRMPELVEAAVRCGRGDRARPVLERFAERARVTGSPWADGVERISRALLTNGPEAEELYQGAIDRLAGAKAAPSRGRAMLLYGEWLAERERTGQARIQLRAAHELFSSTGADGFAGRAARGLRASGARATGGAGATQHRLTAQELNIARLVAAGATSREVGAQLFLSPRTVDAHLRSIFRKLGLRSRRQLRGMKL